MILSKNYVARGTVSIRTRSTQRKGIVMSNVLWSIRPKGNDYVVFDTNGKTVGDPQPTLAQALMLAEKTYPEGKDNPKGVKVDAIVQMA